MRMVLFFVESVGGTYLAQGNYANDIRYNFDAHNSSSTYQDGAKVKPNTVKYRAMIQLTTGATDDCTLSVLNKADKDLVNTGRITNCITEIPQDIKLELNNGTLTLKAGSKVYVPNGFEDDGVTPKFDVIVLKNDVIQTRGFNIQHFMMYQISLNSFAHFVQGYNLFSGATDPTGVPNESCNYNTTLNKMRITTSGGSVWSNVDYSLPFAISTSNSSQYTSIDQIFNGFGYIGSTVFALPGVKGLIPNGRNADGSLKNIEVVVNKVNVSDKRDETSFLGWLGNDGYVYGWGVDSYIISDVEPDYAEHRRWFNTLDNFIYRGTGGTWVKTMQLYLGRLEKPSEGQGSVFTSFTPKTVFHSIDYNDTSYISSQAMPSNKYINLTLLASGQEYTAPANGVVMLQKVANTADQYVNLQTGGNTDNNAFIQDSRYSFAANVLLTSKIPVKSGQKFYIVYTANGVTIHFRFIYAEGEV